MGLQCVLPIIASKYGDAHKQRLLNSLLMQVHTIMHTLNKHRYISLKMNYDIDLTILTSGKPNSSTAPDCDSHFLGSDSSESFHPAKREKEHR